MTRMDEVIKARNSKAKFFFVAFLMMVGLFVMLLAQANYPKKAFGGGGGDTKTTSLRAGSLPVYNPFTDGLIGWLIGKVADHIWEKANEPCSTQACRDGIAPAPNGAFNNGSGGDAF